MRIALASLSLLCFVATGVRADDEEKPCTTHFKGKLYDLNPLKSNKDYHVIGTDEEIFPINVCQPVKTETFGIKDGSIRDSEVASFLRREHGDFVIGKVNKTISVFDHKHTRMILSGGSKCKTSSDVALDIRASTVIDFVCDSGVLGPGQPRLIAQLPPGSAKEGCAYFIEWRTHYACPIAEGGFMWSLFVFISVTTLSLLSLYTILGTLYNRFVLNLRGFDQIPQFSIESMKYHSAEAIDWLKDIAANLDIPGHANFANNHNNNTGGNAGPYGRVPSNDPRGGLNSFSHQAQSGLGIPAGAVPDRAPSQPADGTGVLGDLTFARPGGAKSAAGAESAINPVSHQSQVIAEANAMARSQSQSSQTSSSQSPPVNQVPYGVHPFGSAGSQAPSQLPPQRPLGQSMSFNTPSSMIPPRPGATKLEVREATKEERELLFGDDDEDEYDEDEDEDEDESEEETADDKKGKQPVGGSSNASGKQPDRTS